MKKIVAFLLVVAISIAILPAVSAPVAQIIPTPGAPVIYTCVPDYYPLGTFTLSPEQVISYNIPESACPPVKQVQTGEFRAGTAGFPTTAISQIGQEFITIMDTTPQYTYNCYYKSPCGCEDDIIQTNGNGASPLCIEFPKQLRVCGNARFDQCINVEFFTDVGPYPQQFLYQYESVDGWCAVFELPSEIIRIEIRNNCEGTAQGEVGIDECCCYECHKQRALPYTQKST
jgi:hypothetical protein